MNAASASTERLRLDDVASWPLLPFRLPTNHRHWPRFEEGLVTCCGTTSDGLHTGSAVWVAEQAGQQVGLAWIWVELRPRMVALANPNEIVTNLRFLRDDGTFEPEFAAYVSVGRLVHGLTWQRGVLHKLAALRPS